MGFIPFTFVDLIDIFLVASLFFGLYRAMKGTSAPYIMVGIFFIYLLWILVKTFNLVLFSTILGQIISVGMIAIIIIFQPEIRHFLQVIGRQRERFEWLAHIFDFRNRKSAKDIDLKPIVQACQEMGLIDEIIPRYRSTYFAHIFSGGYSAGYYSYLWAEVLDKDAFELFKEKGIFDKETATSFRQNVLEMGGSDEPMDLYRRFRGADPDPKALIKARGL